MACVNCGSLSDFLVSDPGAEALEFCNLHLPPHLAGRAAAGHFPLVATPLPEPIVEDEPAEEEPSEDE